MPLNQEQIDVMLQQISEQQQAILSGQEEAGARLAELEAVNSPEQFQGRFREAFNLVVQEEDGDGEFARRMRFGREPEPGLIGSQFARWGLGLADIEFLYDLMSSVRGARTQSGPHPGPSEALQAAFDHISQAYYVPMEEVRQIDRRAIDDLFPRIPLRWYPIGDRFLASRGAWPETGAYQAAVRAMDTAESGYGSQLIGAQYVGDLWTAARPESRVFALIDTFEMTAPTAYLPVEADIPEMLFVSENTSPTSSVYGTTKTGSNRVQVDAKKFIIHQIWSGEMAEDSIIPFIPFLRRQAMLSLAHYSDSLVLNGDTTNAGTGNINLDDADPADTKHYLAFDGLRHICITDNTNNQSDLSGAAPTFSALIGQRKRMLDRTYLMDWGHPTNPQDLVYTMDPEMADKVALLDEVITVDKFGPSATVLTGQVGRIGQNPLVTTVALSLTEADGKVSTTAGNNTLGQSLAFNRRGFNVGWRRRIMLETERLPGRDQTRLIYSLRLGFGRYSPTGAASGIEAADLIFNIAV